MQKTNVPVNAHMARQNLFFDSSDILLVIVWSISFLIIMSALLTQYVGGLVPCKLCLWQRWPYYLVLGFGLPLLWPKPRVQTKKIAFAVFSIAFLTSMGFGIYHAGIEWQWFAGPSDCAGGINSAVNVENLLQSLEQVKIVRCDEASWRFLGLSLAGWNACMSLVLLALSLSGLKKAYHNV